MQAFQPSPSAMERIYLVIVQTNLLIVLTAYLLLFEVIGGTVVLILDATIEPADRDPRFASALNAISLIIGILFSMWIRDSIDGYAQAPRQYRALLIKAQETARRTFAMLRYQDPKTGIPAATHDTLRTDMRIVHDACLAIGWYGMRLYSSHDTHEPNAPLHPIVKRALEDTTTHTLLSRLQNVDHLVVSRVTSMPGLSEVQRNHILACQQEISILLLRMDVGAHIQQPSVFRRYMLSTLFLYFSIYLPYTMWMSVSTTTTLIVYPFLMFVLTSPVILRTWIGDPFDPYRKVPLMDYFGWRLVTQSDLQASLGATMQALNL